MSGNTIIVLMADKLAGGIEFDKGTEGVIVDATESGYAVAFYVGDHLETVQREILGVMIEVASDEICEKYDENKHGGFTTARSISVMGESVPHGTMLFEALEVFNQTLARAVRDVCNFETVDQLTRSVIGTDDRFLMKAESRDAYEHLRHEWEQQFANEYGYYAEIDGNISNSYTADEV